MRRLPDLVGACVEGPRTLWSASSGWPGRSLRAPGGSTKALATGHEDFAPATRTSPHRERSGEE